MEGPLGESSVSRDELVKRLTATSPGDVVLATTAAAVSALPGVGGPIAAVLDEVRSRRDHRLAEFMADFVELVRRLSAQIDATYMRSSDYADLFERATDEISKARNASKRRYYAMALATAATASRPGEDELALLMDALDGVLAVHLRLLAGVAHGPSGPSAPNEYFTVGTAAWGAIIAALPGMEVTVIERCWEDLARLGILESLVNITADLRTATELPRVITSFGHRFIEFISEPIEPS
jgi:hypothetical protein